ncbi:hypothetical protein Glove_236g5 [Diversispora epigaea]|uniref:Uncharacterized protein n=1 Tax=Diversispora epigaea TaxID=1348612 RepID=A0A397ID73_9GLOM|nr:hypothetical protein Glove_236g5 [Diversispora epigaea]
MFQQYCRRNFQQGNNRRFLVRNKNGSAVTTDTIEAISQFINDSNGLVFTPEKFYRIKKDALEDDSKLCLYMKEVMGYLLVYRI